MCFTEKILEGIFIKIRLVCVCVEPTRKIKNRVSARKELAGHYEAFLRGLERDGERAVALA